MSSARTSSNRGWAIWIGLLVVVAIGAVVAIAVTSGDDDDETTGVETGEVQVGDSSAAPGSGTEPDGGEPGEPARTEPLPEFTATSGDPAIGMTIPTVSGTTLDGEPITIGADGTAKIIVFLAHWCPHCQDEVSTLAPYLEDNPMPDDVELVAVSTGVDETRGNYPPKQWLDDEGWEVPTMADSEDSAAGSLFGLSSFPYFVVTDADGEVVGRLAGEVGTSTFEQLIEAARAGQPIG